MELFLAVVVPTVVVLGGAIFLAANNIGGAVARDIPAVVKLMSSPGWLDDAPLKTSDTARLAQLRGMGSQADGMHLLRGGVSRRDFELLRQDRRRAQAAYPDVDPDKLFDGRWMPVNLSAKVPSDWCTSGNSHGTQGADGQWYLDGGCYMGIVRAEFPDRAGAESTKTFFAALRERQRQERLDRLQDNGPFAAWSGTGGSMTTRLDKASGKVVITRAEEWSRKGKRWTLPFVPSEWVDINAGDLAAIKKLPSFAQASEEEIDVEPSGVRMGPVTSTGRQFDGVLMPGESVGMSVPLRASR